MRCLSVLVYCTGLLIGLTAAAAENSLRPNVLIIYTDDLGYGDLGSFGHPVIQTPHIDQLAQEGVRLTEFYASSALCSPSRAALLTGRHPYRTGIKSWIPQGSGVFLRATEITLAELLRDNGYRTALIGKWHLNSDLAHPDEPQPNDQGFEYFYGHNAYQIPSNRNPTNLFRNRTPLPMQEGYTAQLYADEALAWLQQASEQPFFLLLSLAEPHTSIENPKAFNQLYRQFTQGPIVPIRSGGGDIPKQDLVPRGPGEYYANITYMDSQVGRVLSWLRRNQQYDQTLILFTSDNGPVTSDWFQWFEVNAYGSTGGLRGRKHWLYEGGIKVPAIARYPALIAPNSHSNAVMSGTDILPTIAAIAGVPLPTDRPIDGQDISAALSGEALPSRTLFWALDSVSELEFAIRFGDWKLLLDRQRQPRELYDLSEDPLELFNLIDSQRERVSQLAELAAQYLQDIAQDPLKPRVKSR